MGETTPKAWGRGTERGMTNGLTHEALATSMEHYNREPADGKASRKRNNKVTTSSGQQGKSQHALGPTTEVQICNCDIGTRHFAVEGCAVRGA